MLADTDTIEEFTCPFDVMAPLEWKAPQGSHFFRFVHYDKTLRRFYVMPLGKKPSIPDADCKIVVWPYDKVALLLGTVICQVPEFIRFWFMSESIELTDAESEKLSERKAVLLPVLNGELARELGYDIQPYDVYTNESLRESLIAEQAKRTGERKDAVRELFNAWIWFGGWLEGGERAIMPHYRRRGAPGETRTNTNGQKVGRPREELRGGKLCRVTNYGRVTRYWIKVFCEALDMFYRGLHATSLSFVYEKMVEHLTKGVPVDATQGRAAKIRRRRIPLRTTFIYHAKRLIVEMKLDEKYPAPKADTIGAQGGHAIDITLGRQIGDIDCSHLKLVEVIVEAPGVGPVSAGNPILAFLVDRDTGCVVSWVAWYGRAENSTIYRQLVLRAFLSKDPWLDRIKYTGDRSGFVHGQIDAVCPDRGPGFSSEIRNLLSKEMRIGVVAPPPRTPEGKGRVEGSFGNFKAMLRWVLRQLSNLKGGIISPTKPEGNGRNRKPGIVARVTAEVLELLIATAVSIINTRRYRQSHVSRGVISPKYKGLTPATLFQQNQRRRRGDISVPRDTQEIHRRFLKEEPGAIRSGKVRARNNTYSSDAPRAYEVVYRGQNGINHRKGIPISYIIPPDSNTLLWLKPGGGIDVLEPTSLAEEHFGGVDDPASDVSIRFQNRVDAAVEGSGQPRQPPQRNRLKQPVEKLLVDQVVAVGELPKIVPRDPAARAALHEEALREQFYTAVEGAAMDVPRATEPSDDAEKGTDILAATLPQHHRSKQGAWFLGQLHEGKEKNR